MIWKGDSNWAKPYVNRSSIYDVLGKYDLAISDSSKAIEIDPNNKQAYTNRCYAYVALEQYDLAVIDCTKALQIDPNFLEA
jgi:tetratricopeptide (TPR) repeat protein